MKPYFGSMDRLVIFSLLCLSASFGRIEGSPLNSQTENVELNATDSVISADYSHVSRSSGDFDSNEGFTEGDTIPDVTVKEQEASSSHNSDADLAYSESLEKIEEEGHKDTEEIIEIPNISVYEGENLSKPKLEVLSSHDSDADLIHSEGVEKIEEGHKDAEEIIEIPNINEGDDLSKPKLNSSETNTELVDKEFAESLMKSKTGFVLHMDFSHEPSEEQTENYEEEHGGHHGNSSEHGEDDEEGEDCDDEPRIYFHRDDSVIARKKCKPKSVHMERFPVLTIAFERVAWPFMIGVWILLANVAKSGFHMTPKLSKVFPESCMLIVLGIIIGLLLFYTHAATVSPLTADVFFIYMLPPIILDAGYFMPNRLFFDHLGTILMFAVIGTIWNALTIGISLYALSLTGIFGAVNIPILHMLLFSSLISAVDPVAVLAVFEEIHVEEVLFILVFGESLLNDGITVVLYHMFEGFSHLGQENLIMQDYFAAIASFFLVALGGTAIGIIWGFLTAFVTRFTKDVRVIEPVFIFVMSYLAYLNAEIFHLSGILSITFCGIAMKNYTTQNISQKSQTTVKYAMKMLAQSSETIIFMFLGVSTVHDDHEWNWAFVSFTILFCSVYRVIGTLMLSAVCNTFRVQKIDSVQKFVISYGGLRGAVAFALVLTVDVNIIPEQKLFVTTTIAMVYFTVFFQGITIKPLVELLGVKKSVHRKLTMNERLHERSMDYLMAGVEDIIGKHGNFYLRDKFKRFNNKYLTPMLVRESVWSEPKLLETLKDIKMDEAMSYMKNQGHPPEQIESFAALYRAAHAASSGGVKQEPGGEAWNIDVGELEYNPTIRDINDATFHHMLSDDYHKPRNKRQTSTYKRHAVHDEDVAGNNHRNMNMRTHGHHHHHHHHHHKRHHNHHTKKAAEVKEEEPQPVQVLNGTAITLERDQLEKRIRTNPAFKPDETDPDSYDGIAPKNYKRISVKGPVVAETTLPWRRHVKAERPTKALSAQRKQSIDSNNGHVPTMAEMLLPWKRQDGEEVDVRQAEHPSWANNEDYISTDSPSNTYLRQIIGDPPKPSIHDIFHKRNSTNSLYSIDENKVGMPVDENSPARRLSGNGGDSRRSSGKDEAYWSSALGENPRRGMNMGEQPNNRHGSIRSNYSQDSPSHGASLLNTAITEEDSKQRPPPSAPQIAPQHVINMDNLQDPADDTKL